MCYIAHGTLQIQLELLTIKQMITLDYPRGANLIPLALERENFLQLEAEGMRQKENSERFRA